MTGNPDPIRIVEPEDYDIVPITRSHWLCRVLGHAFLVVDELKDERGERLVTLWCPRCGTTSDGVPRYRVRTKSL